MKKRIMEISIGILFIVATLSFMIGSAQLDTLFAQNDFLNQIAQSESKLTVGVFLELVNVFAIIGIALLMYPLLKKHNEGLFIGYIGFRVIEGILITVGLIATLAIIPVSHLYQSGSIADQSGLQSLAHVLIQINYYSFHLAMLFLGVFSIFLCHFFLITKVIPEFLSIFGIVGYVALIISAVLAVLQTGDSFIMYLYIPGAIFEIGLPIWLFIKGFKEIKE